MKRRKFLKTASAAGLGLVAPRRLAFLVPRPSEQVVVAVMGLNGRGAVLARTFARATVRANTAPRPFRPITDRKSTRLNSSHSQISYPVFFLKKKTHAITAV